MPESVYSVHAGFPFIQRLQIFFPLFPVIRMDPLDNLRRSVADKVFSSGTHHLRKNIIDTDADIIPVIRPHKADSTGNGLKRFCKPSNFIILAVFFCHILKGSDKSDNSAIFINRAFTGQNIPFFAPGHALSVRAEGTDSVFQHFPLIILERIRI